MTEEKFIYTFEWHRRSKSGEPQTVPTWWCNFTAHCIEISDINHWTFATVVNYELRPHGGRLISPRAHPDYLRFDCEQQFTMFVLRWS